MPKSSSKPTSASRWLLIGLIASLGVALVALSWPRNVTWTEDQARDLNAAFTALHAATDGAAHHHDPIRSRRRTQSVKDEPIESLRANYDALAAQLAEAQQSKNAAAGRVPAIGLLIAIVCGLGYLGLQRFVDAT